MESLNSATCKTEATTKQHLEFEIGDEIIAVDGKKVTTVKQCVKNFKYSTSMKVLWRIRRKHYSTTLPKVEECVLTEDDLVDANNILPNAASHQQSHNLVGNGETSTTSPTINVSAPTPPTSTSNSASAKKERMELPIASTSAAILPQHSVPSVTSTATGANFSSVDGSSTPSNRRGSFVPEISVDSAFVSQGENGVSVTTTVGAVDTTGSSANSKVERDRSTGYGFRNSLYDSRQCFVVRTGDLPCSRVRIYRYNYVECLSGFI